jgi:hypothetical protein
MQQPVQKAKKNPKKRKHNDIHISDLIKCQNKLLELSCQKQKLFDSFADNMQTWAKILRAWTKRHLNTSVPREEYWSTV